MLPCLAFCKVGRKLRSGSQRPHEPGIAASLSGLLWRGRPENWDLALEETRGSPLRFRGCLGKCHLPLGFGLIRALTSWRPDSDAELTCGPAWHPGCLEGIICEQGCARYSPVAAKASALASAILGARVQFQGRPTSSGAEDQGMDPESNPPIGYARPERVRCCRSSTPRIWGGYSQGWEGMSEAQHAGETTLPVTYVIRTECECVPAFCTILHCGFYGTYGIQMQSILS